MGYTPCFISDLDTPKNVSFIGFFCLSKTSLVVKVYLTIFHVQYHIQYGSLISTQNSTQTMGYTPCFISDLDPPKNVSVFTIFSLSKTSLVIKDRFTVFAVLLTFSIGV